VSKANPSKEKSRSPGSFFRLRAHSLVEVGLPEASPTAPLGVDGVLERLLPDDSPSMIGTASRRSRVTGAADPSRGTLIVPASRVLP